MRILILCGLVSVYSGTALAQPASGVVLKIDLKDFVPYQIQVSDYAALATDPGGKPSPTRLAA